MSAMQSSSCRAYKVGSLTTLTFAGGKGFWPGRQELNCSYSRGGLPLGYGAVGPVAHATVAMFGSGPSAGACSSKPGFRR